MTPSIIGTIGRQMKGNRFTRAWDNQKKCIVHIRDLPRSRNGAKCDCVCVNCSGQLEALQGYVNHWSFRHRSNTSCKGGPMTALHIHAQELLAEDRTIKVRGGEVSYSNATREWSIPETRFRADVAGRKDDGSQFLIEIFVTHKLRDEDEKVKLIRESKLHSIEIDLSEVHPDIKSEDLLKLLLTDTAKQIIIYSHPTTRDVIIEPIKNKEIKPQNWYDDFIPIAFVAGIGFAIYKFVTRPKRRKK